jgi:hypothetical protein
LGRYGLSEGYIFGFLLIVSSLFTDIVVLGYRENRGVIGNRRFG